MSDINTNNWSETAANNNAAVPNGFPELQLPGTLNNCARELMAGIKREWNRSHPTLTTGGTSTALTLTPTTAVTAYSQGLMFAMTLHTDLGTDATLNVSGLGAKKLYKINTSSFEQVDANDARQTHVLFVSYDTSLDAAAGGFIIVAGLPDRGTSTQVIGVGVTSETGAVSAGTGKNTFRMPFLMTLTDVRASLQTAQTSGNILTVDINLNGTSVLSTKLTIDNGEKTSTTALAAAVISTSSLTGDGEITIDVDQIGDGTAKGLKVYLVGTV